jgi:ABC-type oligopeptide transport system ATPase subunit
MNLFRSLLRRMRKCFQDTFVIFLFAEIAWVCQQWRCPHSRNAFSTGLRLLFRRTNLAFVFQQYNLLPALTAGENVAVPLLAAGMPRRPALARATAVLSRLGLEARIGALPPTLSGGQQQRVAIARALVHEPRLIVCDGPPRPWTTRAALPPWGFSPLMPSVLTEP